MGFASSVFALIGISVVVAALERTSLRRSAHVGKRRRYLATDLAWYAVTIVAGAVAAFVFRPVLGHLAFGPVSHITRHWTFAAQAVAAVAVYDFVAYAVHVGYHRSDLLWEFHKVHHSSLHLDGLATTRTHMFEHVTRGLPAQAAVLVLGLPAPALAVAIAVYVVVAVVGHADLEIRARRVEGIFVTPRLHYLHHEAATTNRNYATVLTLWDRVFGTFHAGTAPDAATLGVPGERDTYPQRFVPAAREPLRRTFSPSRDRPGAAVP